MLHNLRFSLFKIYFIMLPCLVSSVIIHILNTGCAKIYKPSGMSCSCCNSSSGSGYGLVDGASLPAAWPKLPTLPNTSGTVPLRHHHVTVPSSRKGDNKNYGLEVVLGRQQSKWLSLEFEGSVFDILDMPVAYPGIFSGEVYARKFFVGGGLRQDLWRVVRPELVRGVQHVQLWAGGTENGDLGSVAP
jgi:hypothetical protein